MKLTTIGYWGAYPSKSEATSCFLVEEQETLIMLDCGSGALSRLQNYARLQDLDSVFISHTHPDHIADIYSLELALLIQHQMGNRHQPLDTYIYSDQVEALPFAFPNVMRIHQIKIKDKIQVGPLSVTFSDNLHEVPCCAIKVANQDGNFMVYTADTGYTQRLIDFSMGADLLLIECSFFEKQKGFVEGHLATSEVGGIVNKIGAEKVELTHFPHFSDVDQQIEMKRLIDEVKSFCNKKIYYAQEGLTLNI